MINRHIIKNRQNELKCNGMLNIETPKLGISTT